MTIAQRSAKSAAPEAETKAAAQKLVVFTQGGKGGVGKTTLVSCLLDYYAQLGIGTVALDLDTENKERAGLAYFHPEARKVDIDERDGMDALIDALDRSESGVVVADMGARSGAKAFEWFNAVCGELPGVRFVSIGLVTEDPGSVSSIVEWGKRLQDQVSYLIVLNRLSDPHQKFVYWEDSAEASAFREASKAEVITLDSINPDLQNAVRNHGLTIGKVAAGQAGVAELSATRYKIRAQQIRRQLFAEFDRVERLLLP